MRAAIALLALLVLAGCAGTVRQGPAATPAPTVQTPRASEAVPNPVAPSAQPPVTATPPTAADVAPPSVASPAEATPATPAADSVIGTGWTQTGIASWYGPGFHGRRTANGERFNTNELTAAHKTLPFGTRVRVKSLVDGKEIIVRINDRGPFIAGRVIDLSRAAAQAIGLVGVKRVVIERLQ
jgi:rare lipoprotein A